MKKWKIIYGVCIVSAIFFYFVPWAVSNSYSHSGFDLFIISTKYLGSGSIVPVELYFGYALGLILGSIVLLTNYKPFALSIIAGLLMVSNVIVAALGIMFSSVGGNNANFAIGLFQAAAVSIIYLILGSIAAYNFKKVGPDLK